MTIKLTNGEELKATKIYFENDGRLTLWNEGNDFILFSKDVESIED